MGAELLINIGPGETRVALVERGRLREISVERADEPGITGNIYQGRVERVLPGMQAAFVGVGIDRAVFLYAGDVVSGEGGEPVPAGGAPPIAEVLKAAQHVTVQVAKEPRGTKGARVTMQLSLPGRFLVYMPLLKHVGVSRRIEGDVERERLRLLVEKMHGDRPGGFIIRTVAEGVGEEELARDARYLQNLWEKIQKRREQSKPPALLHRELPASLRAIRDLLTENVSEVIVDDAEEHTAVLEFLESFEPALVSKVRLYEDAQPLFDRYGIEVDVQRLLSRRLWLPSGGSIVIDSFEALTAVDVNTSRYVGKHNFEDTALRTNLEAAAEIARQLRLRNIGGIVVIDFIDMEKNESREQVLAALTEALKGDKARTTLTGFSDLGVVEMTRKRLREPVLSALAEPCPYCDGSGHVRSIGSIAQELLRQVTRELGAAKKPRLQVRAHPEVVKALEDGLHGGLESIERRFGARVTLEAQTGFHQEHFEVIGKG